MQRREIILSCGMLADELKLAYKRCSSTQKILYMKRGLHEQPSQLRLSLMQMIAECGDYDTILLTYGLCGNGTIGIRSENSRIVIPRFHDCIHQLLQAQAVVEKEESVSSENIDETYSLDKVEAGHMYLTRGWTLDNKAILQQSKEIVAMYGEQEGAELLETIYGGYSQLDVIDTGAYDVTSVLSYANQAARLHHMEVKRIPGSVHILEKLLTGNWDEDFIILEPGEALTLKHFRLF